MADYIIGCDEVGWGSFAGPLVVASVILPSDVPISKLIKDSKSFSSEKKLEESFKYIRDNFSQGCKVKIVEPSDVRCASNNNLATYPDWGTALHRTIGDTIAATAMRLPSGARSKLIVDGTATHGVPGLCAVPKADATVAAVAAASIVAKMEQIYFMRSLDEKLKELGFPQFNLTKNKGYGTKEHINALQELGPVRNVHRLNIEKVLTAYNEKGYVCEL